MPPTEDTTEDTTTLRVDAEGNTVVPENAGDNLVTASIPGDDESKYVTLTMAHPLDRPIDRQYLGLPADAVIEVGTQVKVNVNGARALINSGLVMVDPEDGEAVRTALRGESSEEGEPTSEGAVRTEAAASPLANPPKAESTPGAVTDPAVGTADAQDGSGSGSTSTTSSGKSGGGKSGGSGSGGSASQ